MAWMGRILEVCQDSMPGNAGNWLHDDFGLLLGSVLGAVSAGVGEITESAGVLALGKFSESSGFL